MSYSRQAILRFSAARLLGLAAALAALPWAGVQAQTGNIEGTMRDQAGSPLILGGLVYVVETDLQARTDSNGYYRIERVPVGVVTIQGAFLGYESIQVADVAVLPDTTITIDMTLVAIPYRELRFGTPRLVPRAPETDSQ